MEYFKKCPKCGRYMTPHIKYKFGYAYTLWTCSCGYTEDAGDTRAYSKNPFKIFIKILKTDSGKKAVKITRYVATTTLIVYIPTIILSIILCLVHPIGLLYMLAVIFSAFPYTKYILIPLIKNKFEIYK